MFIRILQKNEQTRKDAWASLQLDQVLSLQYRRPRGGGKRWKPSSYPLKFNKEINKIIPRKPLKQLI